MLIAGVIIPSASSVEAPMIAGIISHFDFLLTKEYKDNIPPSPLLSAFSVIKTYLIVVCNVKVQNTQDRAPMISDLSIAPSLNMALKT
jgi:hypothetical protein